MYVLGISAFYLDSAAVLPIDGKIVAAAQPLPHQITAVYDAMLLRQPLRFLLADDPGAGKTSVIS